MTEEKNTKKYPEDEAVKTWKMGNLTFSIVKHILGHYCGYVRFPKRFMRETGYNGILTYVPVHGGLTYAKEDKEGSIVYGFDCAHAGDETNPAVKDMNWLIEQCKLMARAIKIAKKYEDRYLKALTNKGKARILDTMIEEIGIPIGNNNFGVNLNLLSGEL